MQTLRTALTHRLSAAVMLTAVLLFAQWVGLAHRIDHSPLASLHVAASEDEEPDANHSCEAFDAAAVADAIDIPRFVAPPIASARQQAVLLAFASWSAPLALHFSSRAPPAS